MSWEEMESRQLLRVAPDKCWYKQVGAFTRQLIGDSRGYGDNHKGGLRIKLRNSSCCRTLRGRFG